MSVSKINKAAIDMRLDPRIRKAFQDFPHLFGGSSGKDEKDNANTQPEKIFNTWEEVVADSKQGAMKRFNEIKDLPTPKTDPKVKKMWSKEGLHIETLTFQSKPDNNTVKIMFTKPTRSPYATQTPYPCVYYIHGGGMAVGSGFDPTYKMISRLLARFGNVAVCSVDFRNCTTPSITNQEIAPFPAGLNDCYYGLKYIYENAKALGIDPNQICVAGESGGGNLTIAVALKCKMENTLKYMNSGFYSLCPYIAGIWPQEVKARKSYFDNDETILGTSHLNDENNGIWLTMGGNTNSAMGYGIKAFNERNPLAWPGFATTKDLEGLPRCVISVNECDPLRDEGINFYRRCLKAGVHARCRNVMGTPHGGDLMAGFVPDIALETVRSIANFTKIDNKDAKL